jgi:hypothetical protein
VHAARIFIQQQADEVSRPMPPDPARWSEWQGAIVLDTRRLQRRVHRVEQCGNACRELALRQAVEVSVGTATGKFERDAPSPELAVSTPLAFASWRLFANESPISWHHVFT